MMMSLPMTSLILCKSFFIFEVTLQWSIPVQNFIVIGPLTTEDTDAPPKTKPKHVKKAQSDWVNLSSKGLSVRASC